MNELLMPFAVYLRHEGDDHYALKEVYIHRVNTSVRRKMPSKHDIFIDNHKLSSNLGCCWIALFIYKDRCFSLTSMNHSMEPVWMKTEYVMRFNPSTTRKTTDFITNSVDLVVPLTSRLDCYCPHSHDLVSTTRIFSNYMTYPMKISHEHFRPYLKVFAEYWKRIMKETIDKNKIFILPPLEDRQAHLSPNQSQHTNANNSVDHIIGSIKNEQSKTYARVPHKRPRTWHCSLRHDAHRGLG